MIRSPFLKLSFILKKKLVCLFILHASILLISSSLLEKNNMSSDQSTSNHLNQNTKPGLQKPNLTFAPDIKHPPHSSFIKDQTKTIRTVPNSPYIDSCSTPPPPPSSSNTLLSGSRPLTKVKSLGKIDIRSPIPINSVLQTPRIPALDQLQDETYSLRTTQTNESMRSRFFGKVHDTFISIRIFIMISQLLIGQKLISRGINLIIQLRKTMDW